QHLEPEYPAIEILRSLGVGGRDALVLHADHVRSRHRSNPLPRRIQCHRRLLRASSSSARKNYTWGRAGAAGRLRSTRPWRIMGARHAADQSRDAGRRLTMTARSKNHDWLAQTVEPPPESDLPICDPHHPPLDQAPEP